MEKDLWFDTRQAVIRTIEKYIRESKRNQKIYLFRDQFEQHSYSVWGAEELLTVLRINTNMSPLAVIETFMSMMDEYSTYDVRTGHIFSAAKDIAQYFYDLLIN